MAIPNDLFFAGISELSSGLRERQFSAQELTRAFLDRLEKIGPVYHALAHSLRDRAIRKAKDVDDDLKRGRTRGPLQGIPYGAKDLLAVKGAPTEWGSKAFAGQIFKEDAEVVRRLDKAGAIVIGKLAMIEFAGGVAYSTAAASATGATLNPWDRARWAGGSSSGSGAATAAGLVTFALGSETSGSIITPAAYCGVTGLRPTYGLVSRRGAMALSWTLDKIGPLCRSAEDCGLVLRVIAGGDSEDPGSAGKGFFYAPQLDRKVSDYVVGYVPAEFESVTPEAHAAFAAGFDAVKALGVKLKEISVPQFPYGAMVRTIIGAEAASAFEDFIRAGRTDLMADPSQAATLKAAMGIPANDYLKAMRVRAMARAAFRQLLYQVDMILTPARKEVAGPVEHALEGGRVAPLIPAGNLAGLPAISFPCGFVNNLPVGLSLIGGAFRENQILGVARAFQQQTGWHTRRPPVAES
jgi:aspartyl-tRNA(Asn)/glutamyl-tRNA(Gln) amidotransferase subunit A